MEPFIFVFTLGFAYEGFRVLLGMCCAPSLDPADGQLTAPLLQAELQLDEAGECRQSCCVSWIESQMFDEFREQASRGAHLEHCSQEVSDYNAWTGSVGEIEEIDNETLNSQQVAEVAGKLAEEKNSRSELANAFPSDNDDGNPGIQFQGVSIPVSMDTVGSKEVENWSTSGTSTSLEFSSTESPETPTRNEAGSRLPREMSEEDQNDTGSDKSYLPLIQKISEQPRITRSDCKEDFKFVRTDLDAVNTEISRWLDRSDGVGRKPPIRKVRRYSGRRMRHST